MTNVEDRSLREHLLEFLRGGSAHIDVFTALKDFPESLYETKPEGTPHSAWQLLEHMRLTAHDLLDFCINPKYKEPQWPDDYWPKQDATPTLQMWNSSVRSLQKTIDQFHDLIQSPKTNLYAKIPWGHGQTVLREILLVCDHTSYHLGQVVMLRKQLGAWKSETT